MTENPVPQPENRPEAKPAGLREINEALEPFIAPMGALIAIVGFLKRRQLGNCRGAAFGHN